MQVPMIRLVLSPTEVAEFDKSVQLSSAIARGDHAAGRLSSAASPAVSSRKGHRSRANSSRRNGEVERSRTRAHSSDRHSKGLMLILFSIPMASLAP